MIERLDRRSLLFDAAVAVGLVAVNVSIVFSLTARGAPWDAGVATALVVVHAGSLAWRRRAPLVVLAVAIVTGVGAFVLDYPTVILGPAILIVAYTVAALRPRRRSLPAGLLLVLTAVAVTALPFGRGAADVGTIAGNVVMIAAAWFLGDSMGQRRDYVRRLEERTAELEQARDELSQTAVVEERLRIARELHDIVGHTVGAIAVQAGVGAHVIDANPEAAKESLVKIESISKSALRDIRQVVGALREGHGDAEVRPVPGLDALPGLVADLAGEAFSVDLHVDDAAGAIPQGLQLTIYRLVQEALTNVMRHSHATKARVSVRSGKDEVRVEIVDDGVGVTASEGGHGLEGMNERVAIHGGMLEYGPLPERGFRVSASLPLEQAS